ncbi:MarR family winged helix-turn-helix transcriptional regulator [Croceicoccus hydrothermalis]|uniref:MarR family winged helix-turn-helix transcriptional regulator n=1 Tax=Croceicoccus hydrothermalis TaxID=2867964 RepID=UPI001EFB8F87|nr:MarR family winged helix-turn-helix transcriptional regulator [Croceicoccus hydrothermalis]
MKQLSSRLADFVPYRLSVTSNMVSDNIAREYRRRFGLRVSEWRVMAILGDAGALTQRDLVEATFMDKVAVNRACKVLCDRALIKRSPNANDGRSHLLELTKEGTEIFDAVMPLALEMEESLLDVLSNSEREMLLRTLGKLFDRACEIGANRG